MLSRKILIADDDSDLVSLLADRSRRFGLNVETASDALFALKRIDEVRPDVVILDVNMPGGNGLSVREIMSENEKLKSIPVIILTGKSDEDTIRRCHNSCAFYVTKCPDVWSRIEPVLKDIFSDELQEAGPSPDTTVQPASAAPYQGSDQQVLFNWLFELMDAAVPSVADVPLHDSAAETSEPPWVMCIDDDWEFSLGLELRLQQHGVEVLRAFSGMEGYRNAFIGHPQVIILDYEMPDGNGDYVLRRIKETAATRDIPVIVLTGYKGHAVERKMYNLGADEFLTKPCSWETLWTVLQRYLNITVAKAAGPLEPAPA